ncbi:hypothetical protein [Nocardia cyriacigeorgica]|jgi:hypothetical protein|uniref:Uncharacterized protein n=1 Tax=Nocardia cyriacigeorgica TaxID=135487 RepID=A0A2L2JYP6_9NOCA|nr:hypothetical protein [Nocardia cyriacigeorgica]AVH24738.1 hypothetical protein C5B73_28505 [Nocardia cyriacigeorgica]MBF6097989.1 hypothetical protein [Nocardia cyriacigeorgica]MBF6157956.1 hypothetical protein [Nocardia cyriacigeorgica]MBF6196928.1 hypothetical protein [Nocardia cyriacigeorgica]MBF6317804.1 hypothetical protein [Nocardia cyriacigeorgica]
MVTLYANQTVVRAEDLPEVIRAAEVLNIGVKIENVAVPLGDDTYSMEWIVTRDEEAPAYEEWDGRYEESDDEEPAELTAVD